MVAETATYTSSIRTEGGAYLDDDLVLRLPMLPPTTLDGARAALVASLNRDLCDERRTLRWRSSRRAYESVVLEESGGISGFAAWLEEDTDG